MTVRAGEVKAQRLRSGAACAVAVVAAACLNVRHYVDWQREPSTRAARYLYVTIPEFDRWAEDTVARADRGETTSNVGQWRDRFPLEDIARPPGTSSSG